MIHKPSQSRALLIRKREMSTLLPGPGVVDQNPEFQAPEDNPIGGRFLAATRKNGYPFFLCGRCGDRSYLVQEQCHQAKWPGGYSTGVTRVPYESTREVLGKATAVSL